MKALIVEKERITASLLEETGGLFTYAEAHDASAARTMLEAGGYPLVVLDCDIPGLDCLSLVKHIRRRDFPGCAYIGGFFGCVYVIVSGCPDDEAVRNAFIDAGADDVLGRPVRRYEMKRSVNIAHRVLTLNHTLSRVCAQTAELEKAAAFGRLVPGIAHEINNPLGFVDGNLSVLTDYCRRLCEEIRPGRTDARTDNAVGAAPAVKQGQAPTALDSVLSDLFPLLEESREGLERMKTLVRDLQRVFHDDAGHTVDIDINDCLDATLNVLKNELKYKAVVNKSFGRLSPVRARSGQIHQVFLNLLLQASRAIEEKGEISLTTVNGNGQVTVTIVAGKQAASRRELSAADEVSFSAVDPRSDTGSELLAAQSIIRSHNGSLEKGAGGEAAAAFRVRLPAATG